jgi:hypothetical protein
MRRLLFLAAALLAAATFAGAAVADVWVEVGDAGDLPASAQVPFGTDPLDAIVGFVSDSDADMYCLFLPDPAAFSATTVGLAAFDTQLFLFDALGLGVIGNDDDADDGVQSTLPPGSAAASPPGTHYLAISGFDHDPVSPGGEIFTDGFPGLQTPTGPGGPGPITGYAGTGGSGTYTIALTGALFCRDVVIPEPASLTLVGIGLATLLGYRRYRKC